MKSERFVYRGKDRTTESVVRKSKMSGGIFDSFLVEGTPTFKVKEGDLTVRILPPTWDNTDKWGDGWEISAYLHYGVGPDNGAYLCLDKMKGEECPVCEARRKATDEEEQNALKPSLRVFCYVIDRDNEKAGPQVWGMPLTLFREIMTRSVDKKTNTPILIDDPEEGYDVLFNRSGNTKTNTKYQGVEIDRDPTPIHDDQKLQDRWLAYISEHPLPELLNFYSAEHIEKTLSGKSDKRTQEDAEDETQEERPRRRLAREEDVEEEQPRSTRRRPTQEEEPVEEETPRSRRRAALDEEETDPPFDVDDKPSRRGADAEEAEAEEEDTPVQTARRSLERLKNRRGRE